MIVKDVLLIKNAPTVVTSRPQAGHDFLSLSFKISLSFLLRFDFGDPDATRKKGIFRLLSSL
jgi:hypothetical protein